MSLQRNNSRVMLWTLLALGRLLGVAADNTVASFVEQARQLDAPQPDATLDAEYEDSDFWEVHNVLLRQAWHEWSDMQEHQLPQLSPEQHIHPLLRNTVEQAWKAADQGDTHALQDAEDRLRDLWQLMVPHQVYVCRHFWNTETLADLNRHLDSADRSGIPKRRPNGMNRYGAILEPTLAGAVQMPHLNQVYQMLVHDYLRPLGRLLFPNHVSRSGQDDVESFAFTIRYKPNQDVALQEHSDASLYTLNLNLNAPTNDNDDYQGSTLYFVDNNNATRRYNVTFAPGMAVMHRGLTRHGALPIIQGERVNWVLWTFGKEGYVRVTPYDKKDQMTSLERWSRVTETTGEGTGGFPGAMSYTDADEPQQRAPQPETPEWLIQI